MNKQKILLLLCLSLGMCCSCGSDSDDNESTTTTVQNVNRNVSTDQPEVCRLEFPHLNSGNNVVLIHKVSSSPDPDGVNFSVEWDIDKKSQRWTCYQMNKGYAGSAGRYNQFQEDPDLPESYRVNDSYSYYSGSGFQRGHIIPSADRQYSVAANMQTFYYTNMQPQYPYFNAGANSDSPWLRLENQVRTWTNRRATDTLFVCKGGTIDSESNILMRIKSTLIVPKYFFVAVLALTKGSTSSEDSYAAIGFYIPHDNENHGSDDLSDYAMSIDELEEKTGIDFFCNLPDDVETKVEKSMSLHVWGL